MVSAIELARAYDAYISALWRGETTNDFFEAWLSGYWRLGSMPHPETTPAAISPCGGGGNGIQWHDTPTGVLGCVPGAGGCYLVPLGVTPPPLTPAADDILLSVRFRDHLLAIPSESPVAHDLNGGVVAER